MTTFLPPTRPQLMGVLNVTPDSFSDGGRFENVAAAVEQARQLIADGATIIDIGGESTRPGAERVALEVEQARVIPVIEALRAADWFVASGCRISIDTMNASTAAAAVRAGADIINDVSGGLADPAILTLAAETEVTLILSHWRGFSDRMDELNDYQDIAADVTAELAARVAAAKAAGVSRYKLIVDPGLGFAKDAAQNWQLVARLGELKTLNLPILVGASRKRFIAAALDPSDPASVDNERRDLATAVLCAALIPVGIWGFRVHNVRATADAIATASQLASGASDSQS